MTKLQLVALLEGQTGSAEIMPGYNYAILSFSTANPRHAAQVVKEKIAEIEREYNSRSKERMPEFDQPHNSRSEEATIKLLPFGALYRAKSIVVPIPFDSSINVVAEIVGAVLNDNGVPVAVPQWS